MCRSRQCCTITIEVFCNTTAASPYRYCHSFSILKTLLSKQIERLKEPKILAFLPKYFSTKEALVNCQKTAASLQRYYAKDEMNYLASDTINGKPVVCAVERRGINCDGYRSEILFSLSQPINPNQLLYDMLGGNFKDSQIPSSRTVSRIYTNLRPTWWPF